MPRARLHARSDWRAAHGTAKEHGALVVLESGNDRPMAPASGAPPAESYRDKAGRFLPGNPMSRQAKMRAGARGALHALEAKADPVWRASRRHGRRAGSHRITEYARCHGGELSSGICGGLLEAAEIRADASYLRARAAADNNPELLRLAATLSTSARQIERDMWELASREAEARPLAGSHAPPAALAAPSRRAELAARLHNAPMAAAATTAPSPKQSRTTRRAEASTHEVDAEHE